MIRHKLVMNIARHWVMVMYMALMEATRTALPVRIFHKYRHLLEKKYNFIQE